MTRIFHVAAHVWPNDRRVERNVITQSPQSVVVGWVLLPGQAIEPHRHPVGQDTWIVLEGEAEYLMGDGDTRTLRAGDIAVAAAGQIHGARNLGDVPFLFVSVVAPAEAGYELAEG